MKLSKKRTGDEALLSIVVDKPPAVDLHLDQSDHSPRYQTELIVLGSFVGSDGNVP